MLLIILLAVFGLAALRQGEFKVTTNRKVDGKTGRWLGILMLIGAGLSLPFGGEIGFLSLLIAIAVGLLTSKPILA